MDLPDRGQSRYKDAKVGISLAGVCGKQFGARNTAGLGIPKGGVYQQGQKGLS